MSGSHCAARGIAASAEPCCSFSAIIMTGPHQEDVASTISSSSMKRSPLAPIAVDGHRTTDDPKLAFSPPYSSVSRSHSDDDLRLPRLPTLCQRRKSSVPGL